MHAHDRTLLARLAFGDADKKNSKHDAACQYLAQPNTALEVVKVVDPTTVAHLEGTRAEFEMPIEKGEGQYKTTIGFVDLVLWVKQDRYHEFAIGIEVKIERVSIADCVRQLRLYASYWNPFVWVLVTPWSIDEQEKEMLGQIRHLQLGETFEAFYSRQKDPSLSPVI